MNGEFDLARTDRHPRTKGGFGGQIQTIRRVAEDLGGASEIFNEHQKENLKGRIITP